MNFIKTLAPVFFKELLPHLPLRSFQIVKIDELLPEMLWLVKQSYKKSNLSMPLMDGYFFKNGTAIIPLKNATQKNSTVKDNAAKSNAHLRHAKKIGEQVLGHYFYEIFHMQEWSLDLSVDRFSLDSDGLLYCDLKGIKRSFNSDFIQSIRSLYIGFYENNEVEFQKGLQVFNIKNNHAEAKQVLLKHFAEAKDEDILFSITHLNQSFENIFKVLIESNAKVGSDFAFFGIRLITLYLTLESLNTPLNVSAAYQSARNKL